MRGTACNEMHSKLDKYFQEMFDAAIEDIVRRYVEDPDADVESLEWELDWLIYGDDKINDDTKKGD